MTKTLLKFGTAMTLLVAAPAFAQDVEASAEIYRAHAEFLADDLLEGRDAGTRGYDIAALYVANQFRALGIAPGDPDGDYYQEIPFATYNLDDTAENYWILDGTRYDSGDKIVVSNNPSGTVTDGTAEMVFVGNGLYVPEFGIDDYGDIDLKGKIAVVNFSRVIPGLPSDVGAHLGSAQSKMLADRGAVGAVRIIPEAMFARIPWERIKRFSAGSSLNWADADGKPYSVTSSMVLGGGAGPGMADKIFENSPMSWDQIKEAMAKGEEIPAFELGKSLRVVSTSKIEPAFTSSNVVGMIEGSDPALKDELIIMTAHLDHVGVKEDAKPGEDAIYNGLFDNALGVAATLDVARMFVASGKAPRRSIAFVALAAEEKGLLGSDWLAHNLDQFAGKTVVGTINLDMPVIPADFDRIVAYGAEHSTLGPVVAEAAEEVGVTRIDDPTPDEAYFVRSDHYSFVKAGIPSVYLDTIPVEEAKPLYDDFIENRYHKVTDQVGQPIDWNAAAKFAKINYLITRHMTDDDAKPLWYADSYFGNAMAPDAEKAKRD